MLDLFIDIFLPCLFMTLLIFGPAMVILALLINISNLKDKVTKLEAKCKKATKTKKLKKAK